MRELRRAGLSKAAIDAAWPDWWSEDAAQSPSARAELRFALARRLGLSPQKLLGERVEFVWKNEARFKHLTAADAALEAALASFGMIIGGLLLRATPVHGSLVGVSADDLRSAILTNRDFVDLQSLLATCWGLGIPVVHLRVFPLETKAMHAMVVQSEGRHAILLGRDDSYPAPIAFTLAHEIGHIALDHLESAPALVDMEEPDGQSTDDQELAADRFALAVLTGREEPVIETSLAEFNAPTLAASVLKAGPQLRIEPGVLGMCLGHQRNAWALARAAMRFIYSEPHEVWRSVNGIANLELDWNAIGEESAHYLGRVLGARG